jgi:hypothetical protein
MRRAVQFYEEVRIGSSLPLLVGGDDGNKYVVKLNGAGDGVLSNVVEWVASKMGELLKIPVLQPIFISIDADFAAQAFDQETRELIEKSVGVNLGTPYLPDAAAYNERRAPAIADFLQQQIFFFDLFLLNVDRTEMNPNMIVHHGKLWCLDYSSAMEIRSAINGERYREHVLLKHLKRHPFYRANLAAYHFIKQLGEIPDNGIREIVDNIPAEWLAKLNMAKHAAAARRMIAEKLIDKKQHGVTLGKRLDLLRIVKGETAEESRLRSLENKKAFEKKYGRL